MIHETEPQTRHHFRGVGKRSYLHLRQRGNETWVRRIAPVQTRKVIFFAFAQRGLRKIYAGDVQRGNGSATRRSAAFAGAKPGGLVRFAGITTRSCADDAERAGNTNVMSAASARTRPVTSNAFTRTACCPARRAAVSMSRSQLRLTIDNFGIQDNARNGDNSVARCVSHSRHIVTVHDGCRQAAECRAGYDRAISSVVSPNRTTRISREVEGRGGRARSSRI